MAHWSPDLPPAEVYAWGDERLDGLVRAVNDAPEVALDTETTGLNNMRDHAVIWSLAFGRRRICMKADTLRAFDRTFRDPSRTWIFHNAKFDAHMLANLGFTIAGRWLDTAVMHALLYEETSHKLKDVHKQMFGWSWAGFKQTFGNFPESETARVLYENWDNARQKVVEYASNDAYGTLNVKTKLYDELEKELVFSLFPDEYPNMLAIYEKTEAPFTKVLWKCERAGMKVDFDYLQTIADPVNEELARVQRETTRLAGELVNIDSPAQLRRLFFDKLKLTPTHYTKGGKKGIREPSTDADFLEANADHPICASILRERELGKLKGTYIDTLPTLVDQYRRMHPTYNQDVARCMPAGELVLTNRGYIPVEQVAVGDLVLSHMGVPRAVIELSRHAPAMVYLICFANGNTLRTTGNHEYLTPTGWVRADALRPGDTVIAHTNAEEWSTPAAWDADAPGRRPPATFGETKVVTWMATYPRETYGLTVDIDHSHVTGGLVTHNTGRLSAKNPNCFHPDTEFLTRDGWVRCEDLQEGVEIAEYRPDGTIAFVQPTAHYVFEVDKLVSLRNQHTRLLVTEEHRCLLRHRKTGALRVFHAKDYPEDWQQIHAGTYTSSTHENQLLRADGAPWSAAFIRLILATQADGTYDKSGAISFAFKKERKTRRLLEILTALGAQHTYHVDSYGRARIRLPKQPLVEELQRIMPEKVLGAWVLQLLPWQLNELCDEVVFWDGSWSRKNSYASKDPRNASWVQLAFTLTNRRAHWRVYRAKKGLSYQVDVTQRDDSMTTNIKKETVPYKGKVYCVSVPSTFVLTRLEGQISITGQSQNFPNTDNDKFGIRGAFTCEPGNTLIVIDYSALEMRLLAAAAGEPDMLRIFQEGKDIHMGNASMVFGLPYEDLVKAKKTDKLVKEGKLPPEEMTEYFRECLRRRSQVKSVGFGMNYGLKENKLAQQLGITKDEALDLMRRYMERYPTVEHFYKSAIESCKETCRAYSILGRRRYLPEIWSNKSMIRWQAERRAVNMEIQGGAADVVRLAMLACDALDLEGEHGCYMLAQIHDELVFECPIEEAEEAKGKIIQAMMHPFPKDLPVTLEVSAGTGPNWRDAK